MIKGAPVRDTCTMGETFVLGWIKSHVHTVYIKCGLGK